MALKVRTLTAEEANALKRLASSRTVPHRVVQRAQMVWASAQWGTVPNGIKLVIQAFVYGG
jgi:hypothetical protein